MPTKNITAIANLSSPTNNTGAATSAFIDEPKVSVYIRLVLTAIVLFVALVGNYIVLQVVSRKKRKTLIYMLIGNLAAAELGQTILQPFLLYYEETWEWIYGEFLCHVMHPLLAVCWANITLTLAAIAVYRYLIIVSPLWATRTSPMKNKLLLTSFWCVSLAISLPSAVTRETFPCERRPDKLCCGEVFHDPTAQRMYSVAFDVVVNLIPLITMTVAYAFVGLKIRWHLRILRRVHHSEVETNPQQKTFPLEHVNNVDKNRHARNGSITEGNANNEGVVIDLEKKMMKMMYFIVFSFIICYIPYEIFYHLYQRGILQSWKYGGIVSMYAMWLILVPSALHPFLYGTRNKLLGKAFFAIC